jgi:sugar (pentulose or hexulose) kinase
MHYYLGIDAGTTKIKAGLVDPQGELVALASCAVDIQHAQRGWSEIDMNDLWQRVCQVLNELVQQHPEKINKVAAVGVAGQGDGYWPIQQDGEPAGPAIIWNDTRAKSLTLKPKDAIEQICRENYVTPLFPGSMPMILLWQKASHPERVERIDKILHCKDWINFKLTGERVSDYSDVSIALMDVRKREFVDELLARMGLADDKAKFPKPYPSSAIIGQVIPEASCVTGMPTGIPVIAGSIDVAAVAAGMGVYQPGDACTIVGTTLCNEIIIRAEDLREPILSGGALCHIAEGNILRFMATSSGTSALDWVRREIFANESYDQIEERIQKIPVGSDHLFFHPYLYGERAPFNDPFANGGFFGITANHTRDHMARAAFEGVAFSMLDCYENLPGNYSRIVVGGGASRSNTLCKMIADCMGVTIVRPDCPNWASWVCATPWPTLSATSKTIAAWRSRKSRFSNQTWTSMPNTGNCIRSSGSCETI